MASQVPICAECQQVIWPSEEAEGVRVFLWYEGDKEDDPLDRDLCRGGVTHARCAEAFGPKVAQYQV